MSILGLDIGGANIKAADETGRAVSRPFAIWKHPERLGEEVASILREFPQTERIAVTMTAELADCFETKRDGVEFILNAIATVAELSPIDVWSTAGRFVSVEEACRQPMLVAAANWHALATWIGCEIGSSTPYSVLRTQFSTPIANDPKVEKQPSAFSLQPSAAGHQCSATETSDTALLIDIGTTTTDIIPIVDGRPASLGLTDVGRLQTGELSYSGVKRTPLCAVAHSVSFREGYCPLAAELFATMLDVYLLLDDIPENERDCETANGKPATKAAAHDRLARSICCDREEVSFDEAAQIARFLADVQRQRLAGSLERVAQRLPSPCQQVVVSGSGAFVARRLISENRRTASATILSLDETLSPEIAEAACAFAVARLSSGLVPGNV